MNRNGNGLVLMPPLELDRKFPAPARDIDYVLDRRDALAELIRTLPPRQGEAVRLFYFSDLPAERVAGRLRVPVERAREMLADAEKCMRKAAKLRFPHLCANGNGR